MNRDFKKLKTLSDFHVLDAPREVNVLPPSACPYAKQMILRMLVKPKYADQWFIPTELTWLEPTIKFMETLDRNITGIKDKWCYITIRHGLLSTTTDDEWHFDGASFRTSLIPERNYVWVSHTPFQYKLGYLSFPPDFDPLRHNLFTYAERQTATEPIRTTEAKRWYLVSPFCLHRRNPHTAAEVRTFIRIAFADIEGRDVNNTENSLLPTPAWGRDPVRDFRNQLKDYHACRRVW